MYIINKIKVLLVIIKVSVIRIWNLGGESHNEYVGSICLNIFKRIKSSLFWNLNLIKSYIITNNNNNTNLSIYLSIYIYIYIYKCTL